MSLQKTVLTTAIGLGLLLANTGCATKKYVRNNISPLDQRAASLEKKTTEQGSAIESLDTGLARTKEQLIDVDAKAKGAAEAAEKADGKAVQANAAAGDAKNAADNAKQFAEKGFTKLETTLEASNNFQMIANDKVLFAIGRSQLSDEGKASLDQLVKNVDGKKRFVIEIQGFTDKTGPAAYNLDLSQKRAEAVARYLTIDKQVPLRSVHILGAGSAAPVADNKTKQGRSQNRRVEVRLFVPQTEADGKAVASNSAQ